MTRILIPNMDDIPAYEWGIGMKELTTSLLGCGHTSNLGFSAIVGSPRRFTLLDCRTCGRKGIYENLPHPSEAKRLAKAKSSARKAPPKRRRAEKAKSTANAVPAATQGKFAGF